jgi:hypothetical protein
MFRHKKECAHVASALMHTRARTHAHAQVGLEELVPSPDTIAVLHARVRVRVHALNSARAGAVSRVHCGDGP